MYISVYDRKSGYKMFIMKLYIIVLLRTTELLMPNLVKNPVPAKLK